MASYDGNAVALPFLMTLFVYLSYGVLIVFGHIHDFIDRVLGRKGFERSKVCPRIQYILQDMSLRYAPWIPCP